MSEGILLYFYTEPGRITSLGRFLNWLGKTIFLFAAVGHFVTAASNILPKHPGQLQTIMALADIYPSLPLWWVPESFLGLAFVLAIFIAGIYLTSYGKRIDRHLRS